jgi:hypothetical protein
MRFSKSCVAAVLAVLTGVAAGCGAAVDEGSGAESSATAPAFEWSGLPGRQLEVDFPMQMAAATKQGGVPVDVDDVREVAAVGSGSSRLSLIAAGSAEDESTVCFSVRLGRTIAAFHCLPEVAGEALLVRDAAGGETPDVADWVGLVGVARDDVTRVEVRLASGETRDLALNEWRGFGLRESAPDGGAVSVRAYDGSGLLLEEFRIAPQTPPCPSGQPDDC